MDECNILNTLKKNNIVLENRFVRPIIISGPCSAESREQMINTAMELSQMGIGVFRAGIWKPRSRPGSYTGSGSIGLKWLKEVKQKTGMLTAVEVAKPSHVYEAISNDVDILWIGARTTVNPFVIQELAETLKGSEVHVLIKNPINPDLELWIGAVERFLKAGIRNIGVIHRGFSLYKRKKYRNEPLWQIPLDFKSRFPEIPIFCDPSHICGNPNLMLEIAQKSLDLNFDGLMIESHINPPKALSDAKQQITPAELENLLLKLKLRNQDTQFSNSLSTLRKMIDKKDKELMKILNERMKIVEEIGKLKKENNILILQNDRWEKILSNMMTLGRNKGMNNEFVESVFKLIHQESIYVQSLLMNEEECSKIEIN
ncbi:MAG: chorismate mutase [Marinifilaceae bacterium]